MLNALVNTDGILSYLVVADKIWQSCFKSSNDSHFQLTVQDVSKYLRLLPSKSFLINVFTVFVRHLPSWRSPGWNRSSLCPVQPVASRPSQPCSEPNAEGRWTWRASPALQVLCAEHVHPLKQQFPKRMKTVTFKNNSIKEYGTVDSLSNGRDIDCMM